MAFHAAVWINRKRVQLLKIKAQLSGIWAKGCMLMIVFVLSHLTCLPFLVEGESHGNYYYVRVTDLIIYITVFVVTYNAYNYTSL